jgi:hypothetical protein
VKEAKFASGVEESLFPRSMSAIGLAADRLGRRFLQTYAQESVRGGVELLRASDGAAGDTWRSASGGGIGDSVNDESSCTVAEDGMVIGAERDIRRDDADDELVNVNGMLAGRKILDVQSDLDAGGGRRERGGTDVVAEGCVTNL